MQNNPSHVQICTNASWRMVSGIARKAARISRAPALMPAVAAFCFWNAARSAGGFSFVVRIVYITAPKNAAEPM